MMNRPTRIDAAISLLLVDQLRLQQGKVTTKALPG
jgi:hypothetical protein